MLTLEDILSELEKNTKYSRKQLYDMIKNKHEELSGLVSLEGAGHLVARDLGVNLLVPEKMVLKIGNIVSGMKNISVKARVIQVSEIREFEKKDEKKGKVCNLILTDGTGEVRLTLWDKQVGMIEEGKIKEGDVIEVKNAFAKENIFGGVELGLSRLARIEKVEDDESIPRQMVGLMYKRIPIKDITEGYYEIKGNIVQIFNVNPIFQVCPNCRVKVEKTKKGYECPEHGKVEPENNMIISGVVDDGTDTIRAVFFREQAQAVSGLESSVLLSMSQDEAMNLVRQNTLGNEIVMRGRIQKNKIFDTLEMIVSDVRELDIEEESKRLINEIKALSA
ncbi:MAG: OB-fold nucleic acid binding domain-containing protein [Candidatus Aenigmarchaeota archaeon]|nr:OB-fold nucleic acid binding domain-containing protein [Candidatus Aenigmarchaeota archaeon]